jgi:hypothetical protein
MIRRTFLQRIALSLPAFPFWRWPVFEQPSLSNELEKLPTTSDNFRQLPTSDLVGGNQMEWRVKASREKAQ